MVEGARIRLRSWQQAAVVLGWVVGALVDLKRVDLIAALGKTTKKLAFERVVEGKKQNPELSIFYFFLLSWKTSSKWW